MGSLATVSGVTTTPLLKDPNGRLLGVQSTTDGRERVALPGQSRVLGSQA